MSARKTTTEQTPYTAALAELKAAELRLTDSEKRLAALKRQVAKAELRAPAQDTPPRDRPQERDRRLAALRELRSQVTEAEAERDSASVALDAAGNRAAAELRAERLVPYRDACARFASAICAARAALDDLEAVALATPPTAAGRSWRCGFPSPVFGQFLNERMFTALRQLNIPAMLAAFRQRGLLPATAEPGR